MATANPSQPGRPASRPVTRSRGRLWRLAWPLLLVGAGLLAWYWQPLNGYARIGAAYGARVACSCRFEGGRSLSDCRKDFEPGMQPIVLSENSSEHSVTARFPLLASETATFREGIGCQLQPWRH